MQGRGSSWLPGGLALPPGVWAVRHRWVTLVLAVHLPLLAGWALYRGAGPARLAMIAVPAAALVAARLDVVTRGRVIPACTVASCAAAFGLMACSSFLVSVSGGYLEAHFHFFVMIPVVALYEARAPFVVAVALVLVEHGVVGTVWPDAVFGHATMQMDYPWRFAIVHAAFFGAASLASLVTWRVAEGVRRDERDLLDQLRHRTRHDDLTGLANRVGLGEAMAGALSTPDARAAVVVVDLDRFKEVNDTLGHAAGDDLLRQVAGRMRRAVREGAVVARLGGDEFAVLVPEADLDAGVAVARRLVSTVGASMVVAGVALTVGASAGVTAGGAMSEPGETVPGEALLRQADVAMYDAKAARSGVVCYDRAADDKAIERLTLLNDLREALVSGTQLVVHLQPKVALDGDRLVGVEALARWEHPLLGLLPPSRFVPMVSGTDLSEQFTARMLDLALAVCARWSDTGHRVPVSVNVSPSSLLRPMFVSAVLSALQRHEVAPDLLCLELTEDALVADPDGTTAVLNRLRAVGVRSSVDDFGTGFSSLSYLHRLPLDELKVDRSFVTGLGTDGPTGTDEVLVSTIIDLGHRLGMTVVAEGVETVGECRVLRRLGCDTVQGYLYSRPVPAELFPASLLATARVPDTAPRPVIARLLVAEA